MALRDLLDADFFRPRNIVPALIALVFGVFAWFGIGPLLFGPDEPDAPPPPPVVAEAPVAPEPEPEPEPEKPAASVLVAERDLDVGTLVRSDDVSWRDWWEPLEDGDRLIVRDAADLSDVEGAVVVRRAAGGEPIGWDALIPPGDRGFLTAALTPGALAMTVEVDRATTSARIISPGDRVDVILVATSVAGPEGAPAGPAAQRIVRDARVLAVGSDSALRGLYPSENWLRGGLLADAQNLGNRRDERSAGPAGSTFTLEVSPRDAERLSLAGTAGQITLAMRSMVPSADSDRVWSPPVRLDEVVSPGPGQRTPVRILRGVQTEDVQLSGEDAARGSAAGAGA